MAYLPGPKGAPNRVPAKLEVELNQQDVQIKLDPSLPNRND